MKKSTLMLMMFDKNTSMRFNLVIRCSTPRNSARERFVAIRIHAHSLFKPLIIPASIQLEIQESQIPTRNGNLNAQKSKKRESSKADNFFIFAVETIIKIEEKQGERYSSLMQF